MKPRGEVMRSLLQLVLVGNGWKLIGVLKSYLNDPVRRY